MNNIDVVISIGNSDDKLRQRDWADFYGRVDTVVAGFADAIHGRWASLPNAPYQNAAWSFVIPAGATEAMKESLGVVAGKFRQDSIAWLEGRTEFLAEQK